MNSIIIASPLLSDLKLPVDVSFETFILTVALMGIIMLGMAIGVIFRGKGGEECFCEKNNLPRACEQLDSLKG